MSSALAIAGVSAVLQSFLTNLYTAPNMSALFGGTPTVSAKPPDIVQEAFTPGAPENQVNLFLHQVTHNPGWRNEALPSVGADGRTRIANPPLALDLHYLLTAYGSENWQAEALLGFALLMLHENPILTRNAIRTAISKLPANDPNNPLSTHLISAGLADQIEMLKITPATLGREEIAWLWTALKADYRPTFPFQVSVVLLQSQLPASSGPPVLTRTVVTQPNFLAPFPHLIEVDTPSGQSAATLGDNVTVKGTQLSDTQSVFLNSALQEVQLTLAIVAPSDTSFQFIVPSPPPPAPGADPTDLPASVYVVSATVKTASDTLTTNSVPMTIAPKITSPFPLSISAGANVTLSVTCAPFVRPSQSVSLLIGGQQAPADTVSKATNIPSFTFKPLLPTSGPVPVWLRVDGIDSQIIDTSGPTPKYSGPLTQVTP